MIYKFQFKQKPFDSVLTGQVETDNFFKWFMENSPYRVRLHDKPEILEEREKGINEYTSNFKPSDFFDSIDQRKE